MAPREQIKVIARTTIETVLKLVGKVIGYRLAMGRVRMVIIRLTTPPITKRTAARSTTPCFQGEAPFISLNLNRSWVAESVKRVYT